MARRRRLSPEERELWDRVVATTAPLHSALTTPPAPVIAPETPPRPDPVVLAGRPPTPPSAPPRITYDLAPDPHSALSRAHPHMDRRRFERLQRGRIEPDARLDLHGMTADAAHGALTSFVLGAHARDLRLLLVITGKGKPQDGTAFPQRHGILRHSVPHWLAGPPLAGRILQLAPAHQRHGGGGAYYIYLRRRR